MEIYNFICNGILNKTSNLINFFTQNKTTTRIHYTQAHKYLITELLFNKHFHDTS